MKNRFYSLLIFIGKISYFISIICPILLATTTNGLLQLFWILISFCLICYLLEKSSKRTKFENDYKYIVEEETNEKKKLKLLMDLIAIF